MTTKYNIARSIGSIAFKRQQLINLLFPEGYPVETASASFVAGLKTGAANMVTGYQTLTRGINERVMPGLGHIIGLRYMKPMMPVPAAATLGTAVSGAIVATTYYVRYSWLYNNVETPGSAEQSLLIALNNVLTVTLPTPPIGANAWNVYVGTAPGAETLQNTAPIVTGTTLWTEPATGLTATGVAPPVNGVPSNKVLIHCHGHDNNSNTNIYGSTSGAPYRADEANRVMFYGLPSTPAVPSYLTTPLLVGVGVIEVSLLGQYLNKFNSYDTLDTPDHTSITNNLGAEGVGLFLWQVIYAINSVMAAGMVPVVSGFSGGGWTALWAAALDPRVQLSFSQSGYQGVYPELTPIGTATGTYQSGTVGDGEQANAEVYTSINAHELAVMGCDNNRAAYHVWNTAGDTVFPMLIADLALLNSSGLPALATQYGGMLQFMGFAGLNDPVTNFGGSAIATYPIAVADAARVSALNGSVATGLTYAYTGAGHHLMHQFLDFVATTIVSSNRA